MVVAAKKGKREAMKRRNREDSVGRLRQAALEVFSKVGYDAATTRMVAKKAGLNESLIQRYFEGKAGLLISLINSFLEAEKAEVAKIPVGETLEQELLFFYEYRLEKCWNMREMMKVVIGRAMVDKKVSEEMSRHVSTAGVPHLLPRLEALQKAGKIRPDLNLPMVAFAISSVGFTVGFMAQIVFRRNRDELRAQLGETARMFARVFG